MELALSFPVPLKRRSSFYPPPRPACPICRFTPEVRLRSSAHAPATYVNHYIVVSTRRVPGSNHRSVPLVPEGARVAGSLRTKIERGNSPRGASIRALLKYPMCRPLFTAPSNIVRSFFAALFCRAPSALSTPDVAAQRPLLIPTRTMRAVEEFMMGDRLSPDPADRKHQFKKMPLPEPGILEGWCEEIRRMFKVMLENPVDLPNYSFADHYAKAKACGFNPAHPDWPTRGGETICPTSDKPFYLRGKFGVSGVWVFPNFLSEASLVNLNDSTKRLAKFDFAPKKKQAAGAQSNGKSLGDGKTAEVAEEATRDISKTSAGQHILRRHKDDIDYPKLGHHGVKHYVKCWHATGMELYKSLEPSRDLLKNGTNFELSRRLVMLSECFHVDVRVMYLILVGNPPLHRLLLAAEEKLKEYVAADVVSGVWHHGFFGRAIVYNRQSGMHLDVKGVHGAMDVLVAGGRFSGGQLVLHDMNAVVRFEPGTLIAFDGTAQRHSIMPFDGTLRFSHVYFVHQSVFDELEIDTTLPPLTESSMLASLKAAQPKGPPNRVRRQHRQAKQAQQPAKQQPNKRRRMD